MPSRLLKNKNMKEVKEKVRKSSLNLRTIFRYMMEEGYYPKYEKSHILFDIDDNLGVVQYQEDILSIRVFFTIEEEAYELFLKASNSTMVETFAVKPVILDDMQNIMFSCEIICDNLRDLRRFFPRGVDRLREALQVHRIEIKKAVMSDSLTSGAIASGDSFGLGGKAGKLLS